VWKTIKLTNYLHFKLVVYLLVSSPNYWASRVGIEFDR
jgi:hypothetical protein